jgi:stage V sporulation protein B
MALVVFVIYYGLTFTLGFVFKGYFNNAIALLLSIILGILVYLYTMIFVKGISDNELAIIKSKIRRFIPNKIVSLYKYMIN